MVRLSTSPSDDAAIEAIRGEVRPFSGLEDEERAFSAIGDASLVLLGEATQFDAVIHFDETRGVQPLDPVQRPAREELPETFPSGV